MFIKAHVLNCNFMNNAAHRGGGMFVRNVDVEMVNVRFEKNQSRPKIDFGFRSAYARITSSSPRSHPGASINSCASSK